MIFIFFGICFFSILCYNNYNVHNTIKGSDSMQNFLISFNVVLPISIMMLLGLLLKRIRLVNETTVKQMNATIFKIFLPAMIFKNVYESEIADIFNPKLITFSVVCVFICIAALFITVPLFEKDNSRRGVLIQAMFRSNFVIFGIPVSQALCGDEITGTAAVLIAVIIPIFNFMAVVALEVYNGSKPDIAKIIKAIAKNPLIISSLLGLAFNFTGIRFPSVLEAALKSISGIATPLALIMLGASINLKATVKNLVPLICGVAVKLIVAPAIFLSAAAFIFGFRGAEFAVLISLFATPAAVSSFTMAQQMGGDSELAGQIVMFGTVASILTMFLWIFISIQLGFI